MDVSIWIFLLLSVLKIAVVTVILLTAVAYTVLLEAQGGRAHSDRWDPAALAPSDCCSHWLTV